MRLQWSFEKKGVTSPTLSPYLAERREARFTTAPLRSDLAMAFLRWCVGQPSGVPSAAASNASKVVSLMLGRP